MLVLVNGVLSLSLQCIDYAIISTFALFGVGVNDLALNLDLTPFRWSIAVGLKLLI